MSFHEVSAKECKNIDRMFLAIIEEIIIMQQKKKTKI
jgi:GTPase SAR1 family protein